MKKEKLTYIQVTRETRQRLRLLKASKDFNTMNETIDCLLDHQKE